MSELVLDVRIDGFAQPAGVLVRDAQNALAFAYTGAHLFDRSALPISLSLPLTDEPYGDALARAFFENLLQERDGPLADIMAREGIARNDVAGLLFHLGKDCAGALSVLPAGAPPTKVPGDLAQDYEPLTDERLAQIARALHEHRRLPQGMEDPSPLAGVQSKVALTLLPDGRYAEPKPGSGAPTTHILKVPDRGHTRDVRLEAATLNLSGLLGIETADAAAIKIGGIEALLISRFDRVHNETGQVVRIHQEDFAQALGLPAALKYERRGATGRRFDATAIRWVLDSTAEPAVARGRFIAATLFDLFTGNTDAHAKNHALLYDRGARPRLAPRYDLLPTRLDPNLTDELPFRMGKAERLDEIAAEDLCLFFATLGIAGGAAQRRMGTTYAQPIAEGLAHLFPVVVQAGFKDLADLIAFNMRILMPVLGLPVPEGARSRDAFVVRGGGWLTS